MVFFRIFLFQQITWHLEKEVLYFTCKSLLHLLRTSLRVVSVAGCPGKAQAKFVHLLRERLTASRKNPHCVVRFMISRGHGTVGREGSWRKV